MRPSKFARRHPIPNEGAPPEVPGSIPADEWTTGSTQDAVPVPLGSSAQGSEAHGAPLARRFQHYELIRELGRGGMGVVYLGRDRRLGRPVAIKHVTQQGHQQRRFLAEARATARCRHENIVVIHDMGIHEGEMYLVFEYLRGQTLRQWMDAQLGGTLDLRESSSSCGLLPVPLTPAQAAEMMVPVVRALVCAHAMGIIHRDLKPSNVMLTEEGIIKVLDFGVAKLGPARDELSLDNTSTAVAPLAVTVMGSRLGTLPYMSPEQLAAEAVDHRSDIWAVGIMLHELLTGAHPMAPLTAAKLARIADVSLPMPSVREHRSDLGPMAELIDRCLLKNRAHRTATARDLLQQLEALLPAQRARSRGEPERKPFVGLSAFQDLDGDRFLGRAQETDSVVAKLHELPLVAVTGPSGVGKSSLVCAGVIPALKRSGEGWEALVARPGCQPLAALADLLLSLPGRSSEQQSARDPGVSPALADRESIVARLRAEPGYLAAELRAWCRTKLRRLLVFVDQLEELFSLASDSEERAVVFACLGAMADAAASPLRVLVAIRADSVNRLGEQRWFLDAVSHGSIFLAPPDRGGLREALTRPLEACDFQLESPGMLEQLLDDLEATPCPLPLLQLVADKLWLRRARQRRMLTEASLAGLGGVGGVLAAHADAVLAGMAAHDAQVAQAMFLRLVTPELTCAHVPTHELLEIHASATTTSRVLTRLTDARLLFVAGGVACAAGCEDCGGTVQIVHPALLRCWPLLSCWLAENQEDNLFLTRLRSAARDWLRSDEASGLLWTGQAAEDAYAWRQRYTGELVAGEERYLAAVFTTAERQQRRRRWLASACLAVTAMLAVTLIYTVWHRYELDRAASAATAHVEWEALRARDATRLVVARSLPDPTTRLALLREIEDTGAPPPGALEELARLVHADIARAIWTRHTQIVHAVAFSPDGTRVASADDDGTVRVWQVDGPEEPLVLRGHERGVTSVAFSPDGMHIVSASADKTLRIWDARGSTAPVVLRGHDDQVYAAAFSPDGMRIVSASADKTLRVWDAGGDTAPVVLRGHESWVRSAAFSPDGTHVISASDDRTVRVWSADGAGVPLVLRGHGGAVYAAAFSPDGRRIASASADESMMIWNADGTGLPVVLNAHEGYVYAAAFSPDGTLVASASADHTVRVWNADGSGAPRVLRGHAGEALAVAFSPDGTHLASASADRSVRLWSLANAGDQSEAGPITFDDPRLWRSTSYCMPLHLRQDLLGEPEDHARDDLARCLQRVARARANRPVAPASEKQP
jgi:serine/threonine protein kinase/Tol biopolymer transport system component